MVNKDEADNAELVLYNDKQRFWVNVEDNCTTTIAQFKDSIKLQEAIREMAKQKIEEEKDLNTK